MQCLTPDAAMLGDCDFLSANLYARSLFGEDALANLSIEKGPDGVVMGHVRIRSKTQVRLPPPPPPRAFCSASKRLTPFSLVKGIALSLGDRITISQKVG